MAVNIYSKRVAVDGQPEGGAEGAPAVEAAGFARATSGRERMGSFSVCSVVGAGYKWDLRCARFVSDPCSREGLRGCRYG